MKIQPTVIQDCLLIEPTLYHDQRGLFFEAYNKNQLEAYLGRVVDFVQDNHSESKKGVLRGLHYQKGNAAQAKLVRVVKGAVLDVILDIRPGSPTFGQHYKVRLSQENGKMLFIPKGMAHGFLSLEEGTVFTYKCDQFYDPDAEAGIYFNDPELNIDWEYPLEDIILSKKDETLPYFNALTL